MNTSAEMMVHLQALIERDKTALARKMHDELGGYLLAASMDVSVLKKRAELDDPDSIKKFARVHSMLTAAIDMTRRVTEELHPTLLDNVGLFAAVRWQVKHMCLRSHISCNEHLPHLEPRLVPAASIALFRIAQEALVVAESHTGVTAVDFTITIESNLLSMQVASHGVTEVAFQNSRDDVALLFLRQRVRAMGGEVSIAHTPSVGMTLTAQVPLIDSMQLQ